MKFFCNPSFFLATAFALTTCAFAQTTSPVSPTNTAPGDYSATRTTRNGSIISTTRSGVQGDRTVDTVDTRANGQTSSTDRTHTNQHGTRTYDASHTGVNGKTSSVTAANSQNSQSGYTRDVTRTGRNGGTSTRDTNTTNQDGQHTRTPPELAAMVPLQVATP